MPANATNPRSIELTVTKLPEEERTGLRKEIVDLLEATGFTVFLGAPTATNELNVMAQHRNNLSTIQLIGGPRPRHIEMMLGLPRDLPQVVKFQGVLMNVLLTMCLPGDTELGRWLITSLTKIQSRSPLTMISADKSRVTIARNKKLGALIVSIDLAPAQEEPK